MWTAKARVLTTHLTRDKFKLTKEALESYIQHDKESDRIMPFNLGHDSTKQIGFVVPGSAKLVELEDGEYAVEVEINIYETNEERSKYYVDVEQKEETVMLNELNITCTKREDTNCDTYWLPKSIFELLEKQPDQNKDGLLILDSPKSLLQKGILINDTFIVVFHNFLRRSFAEPNAYNMRLIDKIREVKVRNPQLTVSFAVMPHAISLKSEFKEHWEWDYFRGPKIPKDLNELKTGITQHVASEKDRAFDNIEMTDFWWHEKDNGSLMVLEIEETRDKSRCLVVPKNETKQFPLRYSHLQYDKSTRMVTHLDCALRIYPEDKFDLRLATKDISKVSKKDANRVKLFRIDGILSPKDAFDIISLFFCNNSDVREYFELDQS